MTTPAEKERPTAVTVLTILNAGFGVLIMIVVMFDVVSPEPRWHLSPEWLGVFRGALAITGILFFVFAYRRWRGGFTPSKGWALSFASFVGWLLNFGLFAVNTIASSLGLGQMSDPGFNGAFMFTFGILGLITAYALLISYCWSNLHARAFFDKTRVINRCFYCGRVYDEVLDVCPYCGGRKVPC